MTTVLKRQLRLVLGLSGILLASTVNAALLLETSFAKSFPFGPFSPTEPIEIVITLKNASSDHAIAICEGVCLGDSFTYSLGGLASIPNGYTFYFGDDAVEAVFDGQIAGTLLPGAERDFIFGVYTPLSAVSPGTYPFSTQLQIFDATPERTMLTTSTFSGNWQVACSQFPGGGATDGCFPGPGPFPAPEPGTIAMLAFGLAALGLVRRRKSGAYERVCFT